MKEKPFFDTPVLIINFNRPVHTSRVLYRLRQIRPSVVYFAADAPRENNEKDMEQCEQVRKLTAEIDWPCRLSTLFAETNLGCKYGPVNAINWLFKNETQGIILEDDILPDESFFYFCAEMLSRYKNDKDILMISGRNEVGRWKSGKGNYFFTLGSCWGWATWRRAWELFDPEPVNWTDEVKAGLRAEYAGKSAGLYSELEFGCNAVVSDNLDAWDYQWLFTKMFYKTRDIMPDRNLVRNTGFGNDATHSKYYGKDRLRVYSLKAPYISSDNKDIDYGYINAAYKVRLLSLYTRIKIIIKKILPARWHHTLKKLVS